MSSYKYVNPSLSEKRFRGNIEDALMEEKGTYLTQRTVQYYKFRCKKGVSVIQAHFLSSLCCCYLRRFELIYVLIQEGHQYLFIHSKGRTYGNLERTSKYDLRLIKINRCFTCARPETFQLAINKSNVRTALGTILKCYYQTLLIIDIVVLY